VHRHLRDEIDFDTEVFQRLLEHASGKVIAKRILLPVEEMVLR